MEAVSVAWLPSASSIMASRRPDSVSMTARPALACAIAAAAAALTVRGRIADVLLDLFGEALHLQRALVGDVGEGSDLLGDDGEAAPVVSGARGFDRRVEGKQVCLVGDPADRAGNLADILRPALELAR